MDVVLHPAQDELPIARVELLRSNEEHPHAGAADEAQTAEIDDQLLFAVADVTHDGKFE